VRPLVVEWLARHGVPAWLAPNYAMMVGLAAILGAVFTMRVVRRDGENAALQARALLLAYVAALVGGFAFEWVRALPLAIALRSPAPVVFAGRAAYGGLLAALVVPALYLRKRGSVLGFFDRAVIPMGLSFAFVRVGCFLEGCDYGRPTALPWGVRFPPGSLAAHAHAMAGWVPEGGFSLPVHPTELYESLLGLAALALALPVLIRRPERDGRAFAVWMSVYASGRFALELLRADADRGIYAGLSSAQYVSMGILAGVGVAVLWRRRSRARMGVAVATLIALVLASSTSSAKPSPPLPAATDALTLKDGTKVAGKVVELTPGDHVTLLLADGQTRTFSWANIGRVELSGVTMTYDTPAPPPPTPPPTPTPTPTPTSTPTPPPDTSAPPQHDRILTFRAALVSSITLARPEVPSGFATELDALYRFRLGDRSRLEIGLEGRWLSNVQATEWALGIPLELVFEIGRRVEFNFDFVLSNTWFVWLGDAANYYPTTNAYGLRLGGGIQLALGSHMLLGVSPFGFTTVSSETVGVITAWEPRLWLGFDL
jgi:phosphatidylglycerol:prolipoprotein diacylglycerol transferase